MSRKYRAVNDVRLNSKVAGFLRDHCHLSDQQIARTSVARAFELIEAKLRAWELEDHPNCLPLDEFVETLKQ